MTIQEMDILEAAYENHRADVARREADYTRELNAKLGQINAQAKTIKSLVEVLEQVMSETVNTPVYPDGPCLNKDTRDDIRNVLDDVANTRSYPLPTGRIK